MARMILILEALDEQRRAELMNRAHIRRTLRYESRPLELTDTEFRAHYRLTKELFLELCSELRPLIPRSRRNTKISIQCKVLTALSFYATGSYQKPVGMSYLHGLCQASVSNFIREITEALNNRHMLMKHIRFPQNRQERMMIINGFYNKFGIPGVLGCVDGTHVALVRPRIHEERFFNRKHYHSRNVQIICDSDLNILNVDATFGGATHDAFIWRNSCVHDHIQQLQENGESVWFLGDSGYPLRPWLLTPIINAVPGSAEEYYTDIHCRTRNCVERCIGVLKARWRCLLSHRVLHYDNGTVAKIINACSVLHNIANKARIPVTELPLEEVGRDAALQDIVNHQDINTDLELGRRQRMSLVQRLWRSR